MLRQLARIQVHQKIHFFETCKLSTLFQIHPRFKVCGEIVNYNRGYSTKNEGASYNKEYAEKLFNISSHGVNFQKVQKQEFVESNYAKNISSNQNLHQIFLNSYKENRKIGGICKTLDFIRGNTNRQRETIGRLPTG